MPGTTPDIGLILTLRGDFYGQVLRHRRLADALQGHVENLGPMNRGELREAIRLPAERAKVSFDPGLVETLLDDVENKPGSLPLLQFTLREMWRRQRRGRITRESYDAIGGVEGALARRAEAIFAAMTENGANAPMARAFQRLFTRLVTLGEGQEDTRRVVDRRELGDEAWSLAQRLAGENNRLVVTNAPAFSRETAEVVHEALIRHWPKLVDWVDRDRAFQTWLRQISSNVKLWSGNPSDDGPLLRGGMLAQARDWLAQRRDDLNPTEQGYIEASVTLQQQELRREQELAGAIKLAEEQRRRARIAMVGGTVSFVFAVIAMLAGYLAYIAERRAQFESVTARVLQLAMQARTDAELNTPDEIERAGALALTSIEIARKGNRPVEADAIEAVRSALIRLPLQVLWQDSPVLSLAPLPDGRLASGGYDGKIRLWPRERTGEPLVLSHSNKPILSLLMLADGHLASGGSDGNIKIWPKEGIGEPMVLSQGSAVLSLAELPDGRLASGGDDGNIKLWLRGGVGQPTVFTHGSAVRSLAVLADGRLASGGEDGTIKLWAEGGSAEPVVLSQGSPVLSLAVLADGRLASGGLDGKVKLWPKEGAGEPVVLPQGSPVLSLAVLADGSLAGGGDAGTIKLWPKTSAGEPVVLPQGSPVLSLAVLADGSLAGGGQAGTIKLWPKTSAGEPVVLSQGSPVLSLAVLPDGRLAGGGGGNIMLWPKEGTGEPVILPNDSRVRVGSLAVLTDGRLVSGGSDGNIKIWPKQGIEAPMVLSQGSPVSSLAALADGWLASGGEDGTIKLWPKAGTGEPMVLTHGAAVSSLAVLADGGLVSGDLDGKIKIWPRDGRGEPMVLSRGSPVYSLAVPDGGLVSGGGDGQIKIWPRDGRGEPLVLSQGKGNPVYSLAALADGRLASAGDDRIRLWPKEDTGTPVVLSQGSTVFSLAVLPDGRLAGGGGDGTIKLWVVEEQQLIAALCLRAGRNLTNAEWARYIGPDIPWQPSCGDLPSNWRTPD